MALNINPFEDIQRELPQGWRLHSAGPDRMLAVSPTGQTLNVGMRPYEESGAAGKIYMAEGPNRKFQRVIQPSLTGTYMNDTGKVEYSGRSSAQQTAYQLQVAEELAQRRKTNIQSEWSRLLSVGEESYGIKPAPSIAYGETASSSRRQAMSMSFNTNAIRKGGTAYPDEQVAIQENYARQMDLAAQNNPSMPPSPIGGKGGFTFAQMSQYHMTPEKGGSLIPLALQTQTPEGSEWVMTKDPAKELKAPRLAQKGAAVPFQMVGDVPMRMRPGVTTDFERPGYAVSNVLDENEMEFAGKRTAAVFGLHPIPGAGTKYVDPKEMQIGESFWGGETTRTTPIKGQSILDIVSGKTKIDFDPKLLGRTYGAGINVSSLGTVTREGEEPQRIKGRFGEAAFRPTSSSFIIPEYINKITGAGVMPTEAFLQGKDQDIVSTESLIPQLKERLGMPIRRLAGTDMGLSLAGALEAAVSYKGRDVKAGQFGVGEQQGITVAGEQRPVTFHTAEVKGPAVAISSLGEKSPRQLMGILGDFARQSGMSATQAREFLGGFREQYGERAAQGQALGVSMGDLSRRYASIMGTEPQAAGVFASEIYQKTLMNPAGSAAEARSFKRYGESFTPEGGELFGGVYSGAQQQVLRKNWERGAREANKGATPEEIERSYNERFRFEQQKGGYARMYQRMSATDRYSNIIQPLTQEWVHGSNVGQEFQMGATSQFPEFARQVGVNIENLVPQGATQRAKLGLAQYAAFQGQRREQYAATSTPLQMPSKYTSVSPETLQGISAFLGGAGKDMDSLEKLRMVSEKYLKDVPEDELLYSPEAKTFMANPKAVLGSTFDELGVKAGAVAKPYLQAMQNLGQIVDPDQQMAPEQMAKAGIEATQGFQNYITQMIGGSGNFLKGMQSRNVNAAAGGQVTFNPTVGAGQMWLHPELLKATARRMGFRGGGIGGAVRQILEKGAQTVGVRWPIPAEEGVQAGSLMTKGEYQGAVGEKAYRNIVSDPTLKNVAGAGLEWAQANIGDFDYDKFLSLLGARKGEGGQLEFINDPTVAKNQLTLEKAQQIEERYFANEEFRNLVNAPVQQAADMITNKGGKGVIGKVMQGIGRYSPGEVIRTGFANMASSGIGMGVGYNPRRSVAGMMAGSGYSNEEIRNVMSSVPTMYQPALDKLLKGRLAAGVPAASVIAKSYFGENDKGEGYLHLGASGQGTKRSIAEVRLGRSCLSTSRLVLLCRFLVLRVWAQIVEPCKPERVS